MGRKSSSRSDRRSESRSPRRNKESSHSRHKHEEKNERSKKYNNIKGMEEAKRRMREGLESASKTTADAPSCAPRPTDDLTATEHVSRAREIERIEDAGFHQSQFKSSSGTGKVSRKQQSKADKLDAAQEHHDKAIFGPAWMDKQMKRNDTIPLPEEIMAPTRMGPSLFNERFLVDQQTRQAFWLATWKQQRSALGINS